MKSELERLITENRASFETESLPEGHLERFTARLEQGEKLRGRKTALRRSLMRVSAVAASVILIMMVVTPLSRINREEHSQLLEALDYFSYELHSKAEGIKALAEHIEPAHRREILDDIEKLSEISMDHLPEGSVSEEERIGLLFEHYNAKSTSLEMIGNSITNILGPAAE
ncbi:MAG: hypothetical protein LUF87_02400 [Alistipes sp.]|nr:hypothetical protein [Alistipes sp.]